MLFVAKPPRMTLISSGVRNHPVSLSPISPLLCSTSVDQMCLCIPEELASKAFRADHLQISGSPSTVSCPPLCWTKNRKNPGFLKECSFYLNTFQSQMSAQ